MCSSRTIMSQYLGCHVRKAKPSSLHCPSPIRVHRQAKQERYGMQMETANVWEPTQSRSGEAGWHLWETLESQKMWLRMSAVFHGKRYCLSLPLECWDIMKLSAKWPITTVLCVLVCSQWKGGGMLSMCNHIYWLFGDNLLKTLCERHSLAWVVCYEKVTPWPFGFGPEERKIPFDLGSRFSAGKHGILTTSFVELFCCISLSMQCTDKQVPGY